MVCRGRYGKPYRHAIVQVGNRYVRRAAHRFPYKRRFFRRRLLFRDGGRRVGEARTRYGARDALPLFRAGGTRWSSGLRTVPAIPLFTGAAITDRQCGRRYRARYGYVSGPVSGADGVPVRIYAVSGRSLSRRRLLFRTGDSAFPAVLFGVRYSGIWTGTRTARRGGSGRQACSPSSVMVRSTFSMRRASRL